MKTINKILISLSLLLIIIPSAYAKEKVNVYVFRGEGCAHCKRTIDFFTTGIEEEYKKYFNLITYEVWSDDNNYQLLQDVKTYFDLNITGVPLIVIGNNYNYGFSNEIQDRLKMFIKKAYDNEEQDIVSFIKNKDNYLFEYIQVLITKKLTKTFKMINIFY